MSACDPKRTFTLAVAPGSHFGPFDPRQMAVDMRRAIAAWFADLGRSENAARLQVVRSDLPLLVRVQFKFIPGFDGPPFGVLSST